MTEYLTTKELADFLRIKQRKVYDLAASGRIPCSRAMGKLLFPKAEIEAWVAGGMTADHSPDTASRTVAAVTPAKPRPNVFLGSHDPLLDWALRQSRCGLATYFDGSADGLVRFAAHEGVAAGLHLFDPDAGSGENAWNVAWVDRSLGTAPCVLAEFATRVRGLITTAKLGGEIKAVADLRGRRIVPRQAEAGSQALLEHLLAEAGLTKDSYTMTAPARTETDAAQMVADGEGEVAFGLLASAQQFNLAFNPLLTERFDILADRRAWFERPMQDFLHFCRSHEFQNKARAMGGYDVSHFGRVHFIGA
jgi:excisionase family DNA binding protein